MDDKELGRKGKTILADYIEVKDEKEAIEDMKELQLDNARIVKVFNAWITDVLEKKDEHRALLGDLLVVLSKAGLAPSEQLGQAFTPHLEFLADSKVDVPKIDIWLAKILSHLVDAGAMALEYLQNVPEQMIEDSCAARFAVTVLEQLNERAGAAKTKELFTASGLDVRSLVRPGLEDSEDETDEVQKRLERLGLQ